MGAPAPALLAALVALALVHLQPALAGPLAVPCETLTALDYCTECARPAGAAKPLCYLCHPNRASVWKTDGTGTVSQCKAPTTLDANCQKASNDPYCKRCDGIYCIQCQPGYEFNDAYKCQLAPWNTPVGCQLRSKNKACSKCTSDGSCTLCANQYHVLVPLNAIYINAAGQGSQCMTAASLKTEAQAITGKVVSIPTGCKEVDTEFKCIRCADTHSFTNNACRTLATGSKCKTTLPFYQYCAQCDATGTKCLVCNGSRSTPTGVTDGRCSLPCKQLFGIGCLRCNQTACLATDAKYAQGRK